MRIAEMRKGEKRAMRVIEKEIEKRRWTTQW